MLSNGNNPNPRRNTHRIQEALVSLLCTTICQSLDIFQTCLLFVRQAASELSCAFPFVFLTAFQLWYPSEYTWAVHIFTTPPHPRFLVHAAMVEGYFLIVYQCSWCSYPSHFLTGSSISSTVGFVLSPHPVYNAQEVS